MAKSFIAVLGMGKGTWGHVARLIAEVEFSKVLLISNDWGKQNFAPGEGKTVEWILVNNRSGFDTIKEEIKKNLPEGEIAVSLISGSGKEHMAVIAALNEAGKKFQLITLTGDGIKYY